MSQAFIIQIAGQTAGIVARDHSSQAFHFFASSPAFQSLEGRSFAEPQQAEREARRVRRNAAHLAAPRSPRLFPE